MNHRVDGRTVILRTAGESEVARFVDLFAAGSLVAPLGGRGSQPDGQSDAY